MPNDVTRRLPVGAEVVEAGVSFRVWAPERRNVTAVIERASRPLDVSLTRGPDGYFSAISAEVTAGDRYRYRLDDSSRLYPDPASRFQPQGPHGPSQVVDPAEFRWTDGEWKGVPRRGQVIYELHLGTFTPEGTWIAAIEKLPHLAETGITLIEVMPIADFSGDFGWGYDGVNLFAPCRLYGTPDEARKFVDAAHALGIGVVLDVVYNHFGPDGNYLHAFARDYFTDRYRNDWGESINFDGPNCGPVREFFTSNAAHWIGEYHFDGLRLDATQSIFDSSSPHILQSITRSARAAAGQRSIYIVAENDDQHVRHVLSLEEGGFGMDGLWNDDLHHSAIVALTGRSEAYYSDYTGAPQEFVSAIKWGYLFQGQWHGWQKRRRGTQSRHLPPEFFVSFLENHDQVANSGKGHRIHQISNPGRYRALTALVLLSPSTPMLFQGQEFASTAPFFYFAAHHPELARLVDEGRRAHLKNFPSLATPEMQEIIRDPSDPRTFELSKIRWEDRDRNVEALALHRDLLELRRTDRVLSQQTSSLDGAVLSPGAFLLRFFSEESRDRLLLVNLGRDLRIAPCPEPLLAEPEDHEWTLVWSSEDPRYGGLGTPPLQKENDWFLPGNSAVLMAATPRAEP